ncbi:MAG: acetyl-CoA carboxylase biotin carboxyl carrier protein [Rhodospirillaceae bacterium]|jgi:acetyl-CoA carboxylase biotin carboxyl carrier protein|nr:acetyl-CoA carboxylase biotin carboxyl carrier protein [Rhodospirillaceae bacterium]MBT6202797.1 acetyl-CoA carboxylase biotin carboxyl carrier protein [Rhodospirillaceae bacterium]MBT6509941.1 acetyl-CoA carboxylase biotin carboxyl carrier protein [Rhodospirillaceae bacterium]MBT7614987.1 acetyl-CoA carboxylase biotin carboxyl carrier protein [Rhodospirillaceae bacterium]
MSGDKFPVDVDAIRELAELLDETGLTEIELEDSGRRLRVARGSVTVAAAPMAAPAAPAHFDSASATSEAAESSHPGAVKSPMVGTAYLCPEPGAAPYVKSGGSVTEGDTVLIIEAMKVMNPIRAPRSGTISRVMIENGGPVEFGQVLMVID